MRVCTKCNASLPATSEFFHARKKNKDGCREVCRECRAKDNAINNAARTAKKRAHYAANKDRLLATTKRYYSENIDAQRASGLARHYKNRDVRIEQMRAYRIENLDGLNARRRPKSRAAFQARYGVDIGFTIQHRVKSLLRVTLSNGRKSRKMVEILGYSVDELKEHLWKQFSNGMTWDAFMSGRIHIDHIIPVVSFDIKSDSCEEFKSCWALSNLRPMWAKDNLSKSAKILTLL